jgi:UDP-glucuronate 4-epimerase
MGEDERMKILVTGGAGFIGSHVSRRLLGLGYKIVMIDNFNNYYSPKVKRANIKEFLSNKNYKHYKEDITNYKKTEEIFNRERPDKIIHLAARAGVRASIDNPQIYLKTNIEGTLTLLKLAVQYENKNFIFGSSSSVYGESTRIPFSENDPCNKPISPYGASKKAAELLVYTYHHLYKLRCTVLRFFTVYGPSGRPDMAPYLFVDSVYKNMPIKRFGKGNSKRDYTYIDDIVSGVTTALEKNFPFEIINLGDSQPISLNRFIGVIEGLMGKKAKIREFPRQEGDVMITFADISKARRLLGYRPKTSIEEGMKKFIEWYLTNLTN